MQIDSWNGGIGKKTALFKTKCLGLLEVVNAFKFHKESKLPVSSGSVLWWSSLSVQALQGREMHFVGVLLVVNITAFGEA